MPTRRTGYVTSLCSWGSVCIPLQARGALCCLPATVHQDTVKAFSPGLSSRSSRRTLNPISAAVTLTCDAEKLLIKSLRDSHRHPECPYNSSAYFRWLSFRDNHQELGSSKWTLKTSSKTHSSLIPNNPIISKMEKEAERARGCTAEARQKKPPGSWILVTKKCSLRLG